MTRSFDKRAVQPTPRFLHPRSIEKEIPVSLDLDCMCSKNDPNCAECWAPVAEHTANMAAAISSGGSFKTMRNPYLVGGVRSGPKPAGEVKFPTASDFDRDVRYRFDECLELLLRKHKDYGPANIANAPGGALNGLRVRMHDKISRINYLIDNGKDPQNESLRDSFADLANYGVIALLCLDGVWPTE